MNQPQQNNGFLYVGSLTKPYYDAAVMSAESIKDYWPEAKCMLFTHEDWVQERRDSRIFDKIVTGVPAHCRAKLWALEKTIFDKTCYMDADTYCEHEDIKYIFDDLPDEYDMAMTTNRPYNAKVVYFKKDRELTHYEEEDKKLIWENGDPDGKPLYAVHSWEENAKNEVYRMLWHCGMFIYNNKPHTLKMLNAWYTNYREQIENKKNWHEKFEHPRSLWFWDTYAFWRTNFYTNYEVKIREIHPKWNFVNGYRDFELSEKHPKVIHHYTVPARPQDEGLIDDPNISNTIGNFDILK
jgi:hypothetical protein|tara:strand:- start:416 stop:1303 length:888 start_codon:yes stop_codon:yes gene_type:complete